MSECLDKDVTVKPTFTMESAAATLHFPANISDQGCGEDDDDESDEGKETPQIKTKRCRKRPRSHSSATEMLDFLKSYSEKREKVEEEKLKVVKEMKQEEKDFLTIF